MPTFVTVAYGDAAGYNRTPKAFRDAGHAVDASLQASGAVMGVAGPCVQVRNTEGAGVQTAAGPLRAAPLPVAGFAIIEAADLEAAIAIAARSPCAINHGVIEVWPLMGPPGEPTLAQSRRIDHTGIGVSDAIASKHFYDAALGAVGIAPLAHIDRDHRSAAPDATDLAGVGYGVAYPEFWIDAFHPAGVKQHTAFRASSRAQVDAFHAAALRAGGADNGKPGVRKSGYPPGYYAAFVLDPDGNNIEAAFRDPLPES